jgi:hypothetical protein
MLVGINYPWIDYGWDFGETPPAWVGDGNLPAWRESKRKRIEEDFRRFALQGIFAVRWFLLADGLNYGMGEFAPRKIKKNWTFEPLPSGHSFYNRLCDDFEFVLQICSNNSLKIFPSLIDFGWCRQGMPIAGYPEIIKGGRQDLVTDPAKRKAFFDRVFDPLLALSMRYRDSIYAWELINEPEWVVRRFWNRDANRNVTRGEMKEFIAEGIQRINSKRLRDGSAAFLSSVGFAHWETLDKWDAARLGITLHQFHYYAQQNRELPDRLYPASYPCVVGEFATAAGSDWPDLKTRHKDQTITGRLRCIEEKGYPACFLWSARAMDPATRWTEEAHRELFAYNGVGPTDAIRG